MEEMTWHGMVMKRREEGEDCSRERESKDREFSSFLSWLAGDKVVFVLRRLRNCRMLIAMTPLSPYPGQDKEGKE